MQLPTLTTTRLVLRPVTSDDLALMAELNAEPEVMAFILGRAATAAETAEEWAERLGPRTDLERGLGYWAGYESGVFVGWWGASAFAHDPSMSSIGYRLRHTAWGRGLATEGGRAMVAQAASAPGVTLIVASTMADNVDSRRVLEKLGLTHVATHVEQWDEPIPGWEHGEVDYELLP